MKKLKIIAFAAVLTLVICFIISCDEGDDDDDSAVPCIADNICEQSCASDPDCASTSDDDDDVTDDDDDETGDDDSTSDEIWTDSSSGLTWQITPSSNTLSWEDATAYCSGLTLADGSWHLPSVSELRTLIRGCDETTTDGSCGVTDSCLSIHCQDESCLACSYGGGPNNSCFGPSEIPNECDAFWSSSAVMSYGAVAWYVGFSKGEVERDYITTKMSVRCVQ
jgi:uncharacterized protein (TIGR02145 family)